MSRPLEMRGKLKFNSSEFNDSLHIVELASELLFLLGPKEQIVRITYEALRLVIRTPDARFSISRTYVYSSCLHCSVTNSNMVVKPIYERYREHNRDSYCKRYRL